jgi:hypothetical protein
MTFREIVAVHPLPGSLIRQLLLRCAEECLACAASCIACADVSLSENDQKLIRVIRVALDCADACELTGRIAIRQSAPDIRLIRGVIEDAPRPASPVRRSASATPPTMSGVVSAQRSAGAARRPATSFSPTDASQRAAETPRSLPLHGSDEAYTPTAQFQRRAEQEVTRELPYEGGPGQAPRGRLDSEQRQRGAVAREV